MKQVYRHSISYIEDTSHLFNCVRSMPDAIWLDSGKPQSAQGNLDIISSTPDLIIETRGTHSIIIDGDNEQPSTDDPFDLIERALGELQPLDEKHRELTFPGGILGYFGYDLGRNLVQIPDTTMEVVDLPDMRVGRYLWALVVNHSDKQAEIIFHEACSNALREDVIRRFENNGNEREISSFGLTSSFKSTLSETEYIEKISTIKNYILQGDCYQTNFTQHFYADYQGDEWTAYLHLREVIASPYSVFWQWSNKAILSMSPERFIKVSQRKNNSLTVETKPIKGTVLRGETPEKDNHNANTLKHSLKDKAENLMIVDLLRNDISKNCQPGSVKVPKLFSLESFPNVHHLVSTVVGELNPAISPLVLFRDCFPGGSITGAPKQRAMQIIEELEPVKRSVYCGSIGYIGANNNMDTNIAIRTVLATKSTMHCWGGGGIVADSLAENEYEESINKVDLILKTLEETVKS